VSGATGDDERFGALYDANRAALAAYCRRRVPVDLIDDVMAELFVVAWRRVGEIPPGSERAWLYGVARNLIANQQRSFGRRLRLADRVVWQRPDPAPEPGAAHVEIDQNVLDALATLSESDQELLRLRAWEELASAEIGVVLGISASAVDMRLSRARHRFEHALKSVGFAPLGAGFRVAEEGIS
jgi:RNA polymerase sigma-70 factor, ECF subfamily